MIQMVAAVVLNEISIITFADDKPGNMDVTNFQNSICSCDLRDGKRGVVKEHIVNRILHVVNCKKMV